MSVTRAKPSLRKKQYFFFDAKNSSYTRSFGGTESPFLLVINGRIEHPPDWAPKIEQAAIYIHGPEGREHGNV